jgi:hypothetical protein
MISDLPCIEAVSVVGPATIRVVWRGGASPDEVDLSGWIAAGGETLAPLRDPKTFARAALSDHGAAVSWDDGTGELSIDAFHLKRLIAEC